MHDKLRKGWIGLALALGMVAPAMAQDAALPINSGNTAWILVSAALVLLMTPGLAFFYGGLVRGRNVLNTLMMSFVALGVIGLEWVLIGYSLAFSPGSQFIGGLDWLGLNGVGQEPSPVYMSTVPHLAFMVFQAMFAVITPALISGAVVDRMKFKTYVVFIMLWSAVVYAPLAHWVWSFAMVDGKIVTAGWLGTLGALDFAGGTVVHISAGISALVAALILGARKGYPDQPMPPHNVPFALLGAGLLWFGWFGFNAGSAGAADGIASLAFVTTNTATAAAMATWLLIETIFNKPTAVGAATGAVVGLVAITPAAGFVTPLGAIAIGGTAAIISYSVVQLRSKLKFDDSLDVFACHGMGGITGAVLTGVFCTKTVNALVVNEGLAYGGGFAQLGIQLTSIAATAALAGGATAVILLLLKFTLGLRPEDRAELEGLDISEHGEEGYTGMVSGYAVTQDMGYSSTAQPQNIPRPAQQE
ncbi:ammonium transporter [Candidatus Cyanaurora vandensis]|uniref:ammonium transporter n=1 Tax=Candidatus Cyanaurora vandensis TaxID=2714958 RepID=UPI00257CF28B|nr:ammonium transporter [Candidatus Cyanaurora vandensis]